MAKVDAHYSDRRLAEIYDIENGWSIDRDFYLDLAGTTPIRVLDFGCGTGLICDAYANAGHSVTGVDPAESMLEVARRKPNGSKIEWVCSDSQSFRSRIQYDLIIMTGHAFQVLLTEEDVRATFDVMRMHLAPGGRIVFESRNPQMDWDSRWNKSVRINTPSGELMIVRQVKGREDSYIHFETSYHFTSDTLISRSELRFWNEGDVRELLAACGLKVAEFFGSWDGSPFDPSSSDEMIFIVKAK